MPMNLRSVWLPAWEASLPLDFSSSSRSREKRVRTGERRDPSRELRLEKGGCWRECNRKMGDVGGSVTGSWAGQELQPKLKCFTYLVTGDVGGELVITETAIISNDCYSLV